MECHIEKWSGILLLIKDLKAYSWPCQKGLMQSDLICEGAMSIIIIRVMWASEVDGAKMAMKRIYKNKNIPIIGTNFVISKQNIKRSKITKKVN